MSFIILNSIKILNVYFATTGKYLLLDERKMGKISLIRKCNISTIAFFALYLGLPNTLYSQEITGKLKDLWGTISEESTNVLEQTVEKIQTLTSDIGDTLNSQLNSITATRSSNNGLEIQDKIDNIKLYVEDINTLKKEEQKASSFSLIRKSKKDYRIKIDNVLEEIEPLLFDGEVVDYASKIRSVREKILSLES